jgi:hypothetical protein
LVESEEVLGPVYCSLQAFFPKIENLKKSRVYSFTIMSVLGAIVGFALFCVVAMAVTYVEKLRVATGVRTKVHQAVIRDTYGIVLPDPRVRQPTSTLPPLIGRMTRSRMEALGLVRESLRALHLAEVNSQLPEGMPPRM